MTHRRNSPQGIKDGIQERKDKRKASNKIEWTDTWKIVEPEDPAKGLSAAGRNEILDIPKIAIGAGSGKSVHLNPVSYFN